MKTMMKAITLTGLLSVIISCGGESTATSSSNTSLSTIANQVTGQGVTKAVSIRAINSAGQGLTYTLTASPISTVAGSVLGSTLTLTPEASFYGTASLTLKVSDGINEASQTFLLMVEAPDPLYAYQWHINNSGQANFSRSTGIPSKDINVDSVIAAGYLGANVNVAVLDTGLEIAHEDLAANVVTHGSWDFVSNDTNPTNTATTGDHGTSVAGLIAATGWNGKGGRGVAPKAFLKGFNILRNQTVGNYARALGGFANSADVDIFNQSFGVKVDYDINMNRYIEAQYLSGVTHLRGGKGAIYVKSAGNGYRGIWVLDRFINCNTDYGANTGLTCQNANMDPWNTIPYNVVVGALNANGVKSSYSSSGSSIWVSAPGGEYGSHAPAMITTDQSNCSKGYVRTGGRAINEFDTVSGGVGHTENFSCNYTSSFNGTSSSAPILSGAVALMLEANNSLTWRDVKHILASTAVQVDSTIADTVLSINGINHISEPRWLTNGAGYKFHNYYGFGGLDVASAVAAAKSYVSGSMGAFGTSVNKSGAVNLTIPNNSAAGLLNTITVNEERTIESIQLQVNITHESSGVLAIEVTSPSMTKSVLMTPLNVFGASNDLTDMVMLSNAFYGEPSNGDWTIKVVDPLVGNAGQLNDWQIKVFGH